MNKPSERIVVFVSPAQKRAISATANELGISISELMRRAVIAFSATGDQVKAASIVDRLNAPRAPDALAQVLRRATRPQRQGRGSPLRLAPAPAADAATLAAHEEEDAATQVCAQDAAAHDVDRLLHAAEDRTGNAAREIGQAVARLAAEAEDAEAPLSGTAGLEDDEPMRSLGGGSSPFSRTTHPHGDADARHDGQSGGAPEDGKFA